MDEDILLMLNRFHRAIKIVTLCAVGYWLDLFTGLGSQFLWSHHLISFIWDWFREGLSDSERKGEIFMGLCTLAGASLVIVAAIIQAKGVEQQIIAEKEKYSRRENMEYLGWLHVSICELWQQKEGNISKYKKWISLIEHDPHFNKSSAKETIEVISGLFPDTLKISETSRHLFIKLPKKISYFLHMRPNPYRRLYENLTALKDFIELRNLGKKVDDEIIISLCNTITRNWESLLQKEVDGIELISPHISARRREMEMKGVFLPYN